MRCVKCGMDNEMNIKNCVICGAALVDNSSNYSQNDLMKSMDWNSNSQQNSQVNSFNDLNNSNSNSRMGIIKKIGEKKYILLLVLVLLLLFGFGVYAFSKGLSFGFFNKENSYVSNPGDEMLEDVSHDVFLAYLEKSSDIYNFETEKYVICFGTTADDDCDTIGGQIIPGENILLSVPSPTSGKIIIDISNYEFIYYKDLVLSNGYICNGGGEKRTVCESN